MSERGSEEVGVWSSLSSEDEGEMRDPAPSLAEGVVISLVASSRPAVGLLRGSKRAAAAEN